MRQGKRLNLTDVPEPRGQEAPSAIANGATDGRYILKSAMSNFVAATGTADRATFATYTAPTISAPPTQAEVQAIADHLQVLSRHMKALIDDLKA